MKKHLISLLLVSVMFVSACQLFSTITGTVPQSAPSNLKYILEANPDPINLEVTLDDASAVEAIIPAEGGSLSATGPDGTLYTLEIPADALLVETKIKMTPVQSLSGLPFGSGSVMAIQLEPEGLAFNNFVQLKIEPAQELPIDQQIFYSYQGDQNTAALAIPVVESQEIRLRLLHFSGYGVTKGLLADTTAVRQRLGGDVEARIQSATAEKLGRERQKQLLGAEDSTEGLDLMSTFREYIDKVLKQRIAAAGESCAAGRLAMQSALGVSRQAQLLGAEDISNEIMDQFPSLLETASLVCLKEEYELCKEQHIIHRMIPVWLGLERQLQLLGVSDGNAPETNLQKKAREYTEKCLNFELAFESDGEFDDGSGGGYQSSVKAKIPLKFDTSSLNISGKSALINESFNFKITGCSVTSNRGGGDFTVMSMGYVTDQKSPTDQLGYVRDMKLSYFPGQTSETFTVQCEDSPPYTSPPSPLWFAIYIVTHKDEIKASGDSDGQIPDFSGMFGQDGEMPTFDLPRDPNAMGFQLEDWEVPAGDLFATKEWIKEVPGLTLIERGTFKLYHRPK